MGHFICFGKGGWRAGLFWGVGRTGHAPPHPASLPLASPSLLAGKVGRLFTW